MHCPLAMNCRLLIFRAGRSSILEHSAVIFSWLMFLRLEEVVANSSTSLSNSGLSRIISSAILLLRSKVRLGTSSSRRASVCDIGVVEDRTRDMTCSYICRAASWELTRWRALRTGPTVRGFEEFAEIKKFVEELDYDKEELSCFGSR